MTKQDFSGAVGCAFKEVEAHGPWPFVTRRIYRGVDGVLQVWHARHHRKGLASQKVGATLWQPRQMNWWIGLIFMLGASCFAAASLLSLLPSLATGLQLSGQTVNSIFFIGSIPFTTAAYLQLYQAANAPVYSELPDAQRKRVVFGWKPRDIGWISCVLQFAGTILFNINTFDGLLPGLNWAQTNVLVWVPNFVGSVLFLSSGYLAFIETCHKYWAFRPKEISWWVTSVNLIGCIAFMISACFAFEPKVPAATDIALAVSLVFTLIGAIGFFVGSLLMWPEITSAADPE